MTELTTNQLKLSQQQYADYHENGYLLVDNVVPQQSCDRLIEEADRVVEGHYSSRLDMHIKSPLYHQLIIDKNILAMADQLQDARMIPIGSIFFFCKPGNPLEQGSLMHQDNYAPKAPYGSYLVVGVVLDDADASNGALMVYPKTHKLGVLPSTDSRNFDYDENGRVCKAYPFGNEVSMPSGYVPLQLEYKKGSVLFMHAHTVHGAPKNKSPNRWRRKIYMHYIKDGDPFWPGWNAKRRLIERQ